MTREQKLNWYLRAKSSELCRHVVTLQRCKGTKELDALIALVLTPSTFVIILSSAYQLVDTSKFKQHRVSGDGMNVYEFEAQGGMDAAIHEAVRHFRIR